MAKMTREQQEKLCDIYNASDIEALDYIQLLKSQKRTHGT